MAVMTLNSRMVYWTIEIRSKTGILDITSRIGHYVSSIKITKGISLPKRDNNGRGSKKKDSAPSVLEVVINSGGYTEDLFTEGTEIKVYLGYDPVLTPLVFEGEIRQLPDGGAREMLNYTVKAYSKDVSFANSAKNKTFKGKTKDDIIIEIAAQNGYDYFIDIKKNKTFPAGYNPIQKGETDMQMLDKFAAEWGCYWWVKGNTLYFADEESAHSVGDGISDIRSRPYDLGYRTDVVKCNVESIDWTHGTNPGGSEIQAIMTSFGENGEELAANDYKLIYRGQTYQLRNEPGKYYLDEAKRNPTSFGKRAAYAAGQTLSGNGYDLLREFFVQISGDESNSKRNIPEGGGAGLSVEITIRLNEGDPYLEPPRTALLYNGVINPRVDNANLPQWLLRHSVKNVAKLRINEIVLTYEQGRLTSELKCGIIGDR